MKININLNDEFVIADNPKSLSINFIIMNNGYKLFVLFDNFSKYINNEMVYQNKNYEIIKLGDLK